MASQTKWDFILIADLTDIELQQNSHGSIYDIYTVSRLIHYDHC